MPADTIHEVPHHDAQGDPAGAGAAVKEAPRPSASSHERTGPHEHDAPTPLPPHDQDAGAPGGKGRLMLTGVAGLLVGLGGGFAIGRATAPKRRGLRLPFRATRRRAAFGAVKLAPVVVRAARRGGAVRKQLS